MIEVDYTNFKELEFPLGLGELLLVVSGYWGRKTVENHEESDHWTSVERIDKIEKYETFSGGKSGEKGLCESGFRGEPSSNLGTFLLQLHNPL